METKITVCSQWVYRGAMGLSMQSAADIFMLRFVSYLVWLILALSKQNKKSMHDIWMTSYIHACTPKDWIV